MGTCRLISLSSLGRLELVLWTRASHYGSGDNLVSVAMMMRIRLDDLHPTRSATLSVLYITAFMMLWWVRLLFCDPAPLSLGKAADVLRHGPASTDRLI